ncbi:hypothetical protein CLF_100393 [Clonorchis sinensis]|uniref:Uncharacterized protein n=1 Tax=Clonorchis sinensis TaxID=79923 RepID=G7Y3C4_CLOSI|nr:hypothetical protein CLF_100393 [Clonorchis sinensis]
MISWLSGICSKCNRPHSVTNTEFLLPKAVERYASSNYLLSDMTELLSSAATGLSEFAQPSSSDDDQVELNSHTNIHLDFPSNMLQQPSHELAKNETIDKVCATEYNNAALNHLVKPDQADDIFLSSSTSGSMGSETDKRLGNSTYTRPKLPWALTNQQSSASSRGKILPFQSQQNTTVPYQHLQNYDGLPVTQNLISKTERGYQPLTNGHSHTGKQCTDSLHPDQMRSVSQAEYRESKETGPIPGLIACSDFDGKANLDNELHYPDLAVESIRYKIEKLANFIVRLRKRIERDYAEQGTCSPGDDVFGDEAVGATVAGMSTGMHPVVASSLKHLRVLEFNAQEIFNLLYPNEIDLWEPVRACLAGTIEGEQMYNEARSKLTDHASNSMNMNNITKEGTIPRNETVAFSPDFHRSPDNSEYIPTHPTDIL